ncbi:FxSxx-COOH system tetratricopeptide repeat protein [Actinomadura roseirufa]|uniref:FxSxx-COOH system tetratricopeptide repeat protein n=1 Tax=Actinomadura roseirufa TaxID=2094049 RepID=UPI001041604A|nr:FxSxx-COOH system tetratricopeptide repeat protein [Actinomadura roseirufa]
MTRERRPAGRPDHLPDAQDGHRSGAGSLLWYEIADALWLAAHRSAAPGSGPDSPGLPDTAGPSPSRPLAGPAPASPGPGTGSSPDARPAPPTIRTGDPVRLGDAVRPGGTAGPVDPSGSTPWAGSAERGSAHDVRRWRTLPFAGAEDGPDDAEPAIIGGIPLEVPPILDRPALVRALRTFKRRVPDPRAPRVLDEEATAERAAEDGLWLPRWLPATERWLDLDVVMDDGPFSGLHRGQLDGLVTAARDVCAFRRVRVYLLNSTAADLRLRPKSPGGPGGAVPGLARFGERRRRLVMLFSSGVGGAWDDGRLAPELAALAAALPTVIVNPLPVRLWRRTGLAPVPAMLAAPGALAANRRLSACGAVPDEPAVPVPVLEFAAAPLTGWARFATGDVRHLAGAVTWCPAVPADDGSATGTPEDDDVNAGPVAVPSPASPAELVTRFRAGASPQAFQLAVHFAALPLSLPLMRMMQAATLPSSRPADLAEVLGSGLIRRVAADVPEPGRVAVTHDFVSGAREALLAAGRRSQTAWVMLSLLDRLRGGTTVLSPLRQLLLTPRTAPLPRVPAASASFVAPFVAGLRALGAPYREPAERLRRMLHSEASAPSAQGIDHVTLGKVTLDEDTMQSPADIAGHPASPSLPAPPSVPLFDHQADLLAPGVRVSIRSLPPAADRDPNEPPPVWGNVPPRNIQFTGREELLVELHDSLSAGTTAVLPHALHGMGGVGKSQLAIEYVYRHLRDYDLIWWVPAEGDGQIRSSLVDLASELALPVGQEAGVAVPAVLEALRVGRPFRNWLLIFDNAEDIPQVRDFFPANGPGKILVTSRNPAWTGVAQPVEVNVFRREESIELLRIRDPELDQLAADHLAEALGDLPLAIEQAAAWLAETAMTVDEYLVLLQEKTNEILAQNTSSSDYPVPVAAAWNVSLERLSANNRPALRLLQMCAYFAPEPISVRILSGARNLEGPDELVDTLADPIKLGQAIRAIGQYALAKISHRHNTVLLHRLVQQVLRSQLVSTEDAEYRHCAHLLLANADPRNPNTTENWPVYAALLPHIRFSRLVDSTDKWARGLVLNAIDFLFRWGDYHGSLSLAEQATEVWSETLGADDDQKLDAQMKMGRGLRGLGHHRQAYESDKVARDILVAKYGEEHERSLEAKGYVCIGLRMLGDFAGALEIDRQLYETARRRFGPDEPITLTHAFYYGISLRLNGRSEEAEQLDRDTHARQARVIGEDHLSSFSSLAATAADVMESGRYLEARDLFRQLTQRIKARYGTDHPGTIANISSLSVAERKAGDHDAALALSAEALELGRARYGDDSPATVIGALNHAVNLRQTGDLPQSIVVGEQVVERYVQMYGSQHPHTSAARINVAVSLRHSGRVEEARRMDEQALALLVDGVGEEHPWSIIGAINLASDAVALGDLEFAVDLGRAALERAQRVNGVDHPTTLAAMLNLSLDLRKPGGASQIEAETLFADAVARYRRVLGETHPATIAAGQSRRADCDIHPLPL